ncbi:TlpA disulfide reductase family protein [Chitinophaga defluvii]|uniref:TlpA disulfide reductase family protein n=1 Tax=Chitinophaga defluvii TaxID=3163343 RepID=A0ABV2SZ33_9BACT
MKAIKILVILLVCRNAHAQEYTLNAFIDGLTDGPVYLYRDDKTDTSFSKHGHFTFKGKVPHPQEAFLGFTDKSNFSFFLENQPIRITGQKKALEQLKITGGKTQQEYNAYKQLLQPVTDKIAPLYDLLQKEKEKKDSIFEVVQRIMDTAYYPLSTAFVKQHPDSYVSLYKLKELLYSKPVSEIEPAFAGLSSRLRNSAAGRQMQHEFDQIHLTAPGKPAIDFTMNTPEGKPVTLSSFRGSYVLLDFWASWCGPCRKENPALKKAYERFRGSNFQILAVSLDKDSSAWVKAITIDQLPWHHVADLKIWKNAAAQLYNVKSIPANFLISPDGIILAKNLNGEALEEKLATLIK